MKDKTMYARTIIWLGLTGFSCLYYSMGLYDDVSFREVIAGGYYSGFGFLVHWGFTRWMK